MATTPVPESQSSQTLARALALLAAFTAGRAEWGVRELARELGLSPPTVHRLLTTFQNAGYIEQDPDTQRYFLGPMVLQLAQSYERHNPLPAIATKVFESYRERFAHNFYLGVSSPQYDLVYLAVLDGSGPIKVVTEPGGRTTGLHTTAAGKVLLASNGDEFVERYLRHVTFRPLTARTIQSATELWKQIEEIRSLGYAINDGEHFDEIGSVGVPLSDRSGRFVAAVSLAYPRQLIEAGELEVAALVKLAGEIAREIALRSPA